ncbi:CdaR family transcriptional regulator [Virgibacillus halophilus]|uniref:Sugar diacid recognition domain-containing protein n=1 Tax=Tigheibacillus halophilus TaxID=361280 RepID=A0ABU5C448_9BACI|nr:sugar diacid recognition domain-containing protein [Virgibacillus halophilus]
MLTVKIADAIVEETSSRINRNVNIMDINGSIIATRDKNRIDTIHQGSLQVLKTGKPVIIHAAENEVWEGSQPGINLPIVFQEKIIGVIGITGDPQEMGDIGELVKMTTELMINQAFIASQHEWKQRMKEMITEQLLKKEPSYSDIERGLESLSFTLKPPFTCLLLVHAADTSAHQTLIQKLEGIFGADKAIVSYIRFNQIFIATTGFDSAQIKERLEVISSTLKRQDISFQIAYSMPFSSLADFYQAYTDCKLALKICPPEQEIVSFAANETESLIYHVNETIGNRFASKILQHLDDTKINTLNSLFHYNLNIQHTADALFVHRNTLIYRLNKITRETGLDPRNFKDALALQIALWIHHRTQSEQQHTAADNKK